MEQQVDHFYDEDTGMFIINPEVKMAHVLGEDVDNPKAPFRKIEKWWYGHGYCERSYMSDYEDELGKERVRQLYEEQKFDISQATIHHGVHTDSEGLTYNSITWADEN